MSKLAALPRCPGARTLQVAACVMAIWALCDNKAYAGVTVLTEPLSAPTGQAEQRPPSPQWPPADEADLAQVLSVLRATAQSEAIAHPSATPSKPPSAAATAAWRLGLLALHGIGMGLDTGQAQHWFERAHALGHPLAPAGLAWCDISGCVTAPNPAAAGHWTALLTRTEPGLAKYLNWHAARALAPLGTGSPARPRNAQSSPAGAARTAVTEPHPLLRAAAQAGSAQAMNALGLEYLANGQTEKALEQFRAAARQSSAAASNAQMLADQMQQRRGPLASLMQPSAPNTSDKEPGLENRASSGGDLYTQAQRYHRGDGVPSNYTEAVRLYQAAASRGDARARKMLELIFSRPAPGGGLDPAWMQQLASLPMQAQGLTRTAPLPLSPQGWQQDPTPLYHLIPPQWRKLAGR